MRVVERFRGREGSLYAAVFDGHGGDGVSRAAADRLHVLLAAEMASLPAEAALGRAFRTLDAETAAEPSGSTAVVLVLQGGRATVANVGDSHAMLVSAGGARIVTADHRLTNEEEYRHVVAAGAKIWGPYLCLPDGAGVMVTRALGDRAFRSVGLRCEPSVTSLDLGKEDEAFVLASDGVWDAVEEDIVADLARQAASAKAAVERIVEAGLAFGTDNVGSVVVRL